MDLTSTATYNKGKLLGAGTFGKVYCVESRSDGKNFIVKEVDLERICLMADRAQFDQTKLLAMTRQEAKLLLGFSHPNIVKVFTSFDEADHFYIVMEYCSAGDLKTSILRQSKQSEHFPESQVLSWAAQLLLALSYLHNKNTLHRDIKAENVFLVHDGRLVKLGDFGLAKTVTMTTVVGQTNVIGTPTHYSPEFCDNQQYTFKSEMWAFGVLLYHITCLSLPYDTQDVRHLYEAIRTNSPRPIPEKYSPELRSLILDKLLAMNPDERPLASQLLAHPCLLGTFSDLVASGIILSSSPAATEAMTVVNNTAPRTPQLPIAAPPNIQEQVTNDYQEIAFHSLHSDNIKLKSGGREAHRKNDFHGICFSNRPVKMNELVIFKTLKTDIIWGGGFEVGYIDVDPQVLKKLEPGILGTTLLSNNKNLNSKKVLYCVSVVEGNDKRNLMLEKDDTVELKIAEDGKIAFRNRRNLASETDAIPIDKLRNNKFWLICNVYGRTAAVSISSSLQNE